MMFKTKGPVPEEDYTIPFGVADVKRSGEDITLVATSSMVYVALDAADLLAAENISAEVVDPRTTFPLDQTDADRFRKKNQPRHRHRRRLPALRRDGRDRLGHRRRCFLSPRRAGQTHGRHGCARAVFAFSRPGGLDRTHGGIGRGGRQEPLCRELEQENHGTKNVWPNGCHWEQRVDFARLRSERLERVKKLLSQS